MKEWDQPLIFAFAIFFTVVGMMAVWSWFAASLGWTGLLGLLKGGVM
jgi:hypothetical protein